MREGAWVGRAPADSGSGRHVEEGTWCCSNDDACRSAAPPIAPLPSRRVAASRGQYRWCGGGGSLHRPAAGAAITSMRGGCRRLVWLEAYADRPSPTADPAPGVWGEPRSSSLMVYGGGGGGSPFPPAAIPIPPRSREVARTPYALSPQRLSVLAVPLRGVFQVLTTQGDRGQKDRLRSCRSAPTSGEVLPRLSGFLSGRVNPSLGETASAVPTAGWYVARIR